jgi:hypothetical protein
MPSFSITNFTTSPPAPQEKHHVDGKGRGLFAMEGAQPHVALRAGLLQPHIFPDDAHNIDRRFKLLDEIHEDPWIYYPAPVRRAAITRGMPARSGSMRTELLRRVETFRKPASSLPR